MKTDELVDLLANGDIAVDAGAPARRAAAALALALVASVALMAIVLGVLPVLDLYVRQPMFWVKGAFGVALAGAGIAAAWRMARPGVKLGRVAAAAAAPVIAMWLLAAFALMRAEPVQRGEMVMGETWAACPFNIAMLSAPLLAGALWALKGYAPTRLRLAGAAAGLAAGATGALVYTLHCPELAAPFLGVWYVIGMLIPTALGALLGPRVLRW